MIISELTGKIELILKEAYNKEKAFKKFMNKMYAAEKTVEYIGCYSEEEVEEELAKI